MDNSKDIVRFEIPEDINREQLFGTLDANIKQVEKGYRHVNRNAR